MDRAVIGFFLGVILTLMMVVAAKEEIKRGCELNLPRTQHCKLIAVPDKGE